MSQKVLRRFQVFGDNEHTRIEDPDGEWVRFSDVESFVDGSVMNVTLHPMDAKDPTFGPFRCCRFTLRLQGVREFRYEQSDAVMHILELPSGYYMVECEAA